MGLFDCLFGRKPKAAPNAVTAWQIGPIVNGENRSPKMPLHPTKHPEGWQLDFPHPNKAAGHVHYVTRKTGSILGMTRMVLRGRIEADPSVAFVPQEFLDREPLMALFIQRKGDKWNKKTPFHRFWSGERPVVRAGEIDFAYSFDERWGSVYGKSSLDHPREFRDALRNAERIGFTFGHFSGSGHGIFATGPAKLIVTHFGVE